MSLVISILSVGSVHVMLLIRAGYFVEFSGNINVQIFMTKKLQLDFGDKNVAFDLKVFGQYTPPVVLICPKLLNYNA